MYITYTGDKSDSLYFTSGKKYEVISKEGDIFRVIDETGEDYLYCIDDKDFEWHGRIKDIPDEVLLAELSLSNEFFGEDDIMNLYQQATKEVAAGLQSKPKKKQFNFRIRKEFEFKIEKPLTFKFSGLYFVAEGTLVKGVLPIVVGKDINVVERLIEKYPLPKGNFTKAEDWKKMRGTTTAVHKTLGVAKEVEIHWYECPQIGKVDFKHKPRPSDYG